MRTLKRLLIISPILAGALYTQIARAEKMNSDTQDLVVGKMERVLKAMDVKDPSWVPTQQRLADTLAERARTRFMQEVEANCDGCKGSKADRQKAIQIYESILSQVKLNEHGPILFQLGHLYQMAGQNDKAIELFQSITKDAKKKSISADIVSRSHAELGDLLFQKGKFKEAKANYEVALKDRKLQNRALVIYNMAWCDFNQDKLNPAVKTMEGLLSKPELITRDTEEGSKYDPVFHADIVRDLGTFYARRNITTREIARFEVLSPKEKRKELLLNFAQEADRIGQKQAAHDILSRYLDQEGLSDTETLEAFVRMAKINYDRGQTGQSTRDFEKAAKAFKNTCKDPSKCEELKKTMKTYVTELHRSKKLKPDQDLLNSYVIYANTFPEDTEMTTRGAQVAMDMGKPAVAAQLYRAISDNSDLSDKERQNALLNEVAAGEKSGDVNLQRAAYINFLKKGKDEGKSFEVRYQMAYLNYQQKQLKEAAVAFNDLATDKKGKPELRKKSADLALDSLAQLKNDEQIQELAANYAAIFPAHKAEFEATSRKALMNQAAALANNPNSSKSDMRTVLKRITNTNLASANAEEKVLFYTNESIMAQKLGEDEIYVQALNKLIASDVSAARKEALLEQLTGYYEKKLDFANAYKTALRLKMPKVSEKDREFRLGTLADLANMNPQRHYRAALKLGIKGDRAMVMRTRLVLMSSNPAAELKAQSSELRRSPAVLNETALLVFARNGMSNSLRSVLDMKEIRNRSAAQFIQKQPFYSKAANFKGQIAAHMISTKSDRQMQRDITERIKLLAKADALLADANRTRDITAQLMALEVVAIENDRMVRDLVNLPMPKGLTPQEQAQYVGILKAKSKPYLMKAKFAEQREQDLLNNSSALAQMAQDYRTARPEIQNILKREMTLITQLQASGKMKSAVSDALNSSQASASDLASARKSVAAEPNNAGEIVKLKTLETKMGHPLMASYLEGRLNQLQRGKSL
ncbi:tetratricopeptide repeat protein [Bdellovibrio sp. SKB1291214]|uniref:tetratricopeptide repeat protein n=1 Tax=Bdellovibrio sp. SKB1291214 TaxID=1732569 RepID=UPI000B51A305|nr:tetratricopeptide repeat protein [Bdellovibrio sp. SKB1291214]UYL08133.1 tetratricopeptide repeat protein [Bdellovibrio sp. SKB1291214]